MNLNQILDRQSQTSLLPFSRVKGTLVLPHQPWDNPILDENGREIKVHRTLTMEGILKPGAELYGQLPWGTSWAEHPEMRNALIDLRDLAVGSGGWFTEDDEGAEFEFLIMPPERKGGEVMAEGEVVGRR